MCCTTRLRSARSDLGLTAHSRSAALSFGPSMAADAAAGSTISVTQLEHMLKEREEGSRDFVLVDVREPNEYEINKIPGSVLIPKGDFLNGSALEKLPSDKQVVLQCKSGVRSAECLAIVKGAGYADAVHVGGGVVASQGSGGPPSSRDTK